MTCFLGPHRAERGKKKRKALWKLLSAMTLGRHQRYNSQTTSLKKSLDCFALKESAGPGSTVDPGRRNNGLPIGRGDFNRTKGIRHPQLFQDIGTAKITPGRND